MRFLSQNVNNVLAGRSCIVISIVPLIICHAQIHIFGHQMLQSELIFLSNGNHGGSHSGVIMEVQHFIQTGVLENCAQVELNGQVCWTQGIVLSEGIANLL